MSANVYPVVLYPKLILKFLADGSQTNQLNHQKINSLSSITVKKNPKYFSQLSPNLVGIALFIIALFFFIFWLLIQFNNLIGLALGLILLGLSSFQNYIFRFSANRQIKVKNQPIKQLNKIDSSTKMSARSIQLKHLLKGKVLQPSGTSIVQQGVSEKTFFRHLQTIFPGVQQGLEFSSNYKYPYSADFVYIHSSGLSLDLEIDEPYVGNTKQPHHTIDRSKDEIRNQFFTANNWIVIRFAEEQVVRYPLSCCKVIADVIEEVGGDPTFSERLKDISSLPPVPRWNAKQARRMAKQDYRYSYLCQQGGTR
jgi:hypothetical protein